MADARFESCVAPLASAPPRQANCDGKSGRKAALYQSGSGWHPLCFNQRAGLGNTIHARWPRRRTMLNTTRIVAALALAAAFAIPAQAQPNALTSYETCLAQHPSAAEALSTNPSLYRSPGFMVQHPDVWSYLNQNPALYQSLAAKAPAYSPDAAAFNLSNYLHYHPDIAQALAANPSLVNNRAYLNQHP